MNEITDGKGVNVVYDAVGKDTFLKGFDCLRPLGTMVLFGASSGAPEPINPALLQAKGSLFLTRPSLFNYIADHESLTQSALELFDVVSTGAIAVEVNQEHALSNAPESHRELEGRRTTGATILIP